MYLKSIDMQGFKSFAGKTKLEFHDGITGIVGPNGSGKSNVADAVRWVLGEQSAKQLRGGNMQDVIFAGTESRKPLGYASVAITLDNQDKQLKFDAEEVTVTRRLYRSGESEYLLNGRNCRLRDIQELFYDTGIGKEGYSIIGQGQIDKILSGKPEDRRELFDEAAGIVKFKRRKAASLKKLEQEESNLVRVNDILTELTRQLGPLEGQAKKAEIYLQKRDALRDMDIQLFLTESGYTKTQQKELQEKKEIAQTQLQELNLTFAKTREEYDQVEKDLEKIEESITDNRETVQRLALQKQEAEGKILLLQEQIKGAQEQSALQQSHIDQVLQSLQERQQALQEQETEKASTQESLSAAEEKRGQAETTLQQIQEEIAKHTLEAEQGRAETIALLNARSGIREKLQRYDTMREQIEIRKAELSARMLEMKGEKTAEEQKEESLRQALSDIVSQAEKTQTEQKKKEVRLEELHRVLGDTSQQLEEKQASYHRDTSRLESLRSLAERYEGYGNSVKKVMELKKQRSGIHGVLAELIKTEKQYETAIETALGGKLQNIVTDSSDTAKSLIQFLKENHLGRATFLPADSMREVDHLTRQEVLQETGVLGKASDLVQAPQAYATILEQLLGRTIVVDTISNAIAIGKKYEQGVRMVTLEGELLSRGGSLTGGSFKGNSNLLGRKRQIQELEQLVASSQKELDVLQQKMEQVKSERTVLRQESAALLEVLQDLQLRQNTAQVNLDAGQERVRVIREEYEKLTAERTEIEGQIAEITETSQLIQEELTHSEAEEKRLEDSIRGLTDAAASLQEKEQYALAAQEEARLLHSGLQQQMAFVEERIRSIQEELTRTEEEKKTLEENLQAESVDVQGKQKEIERLHEEIQHYTENAQMYEEAIHSSLQQKEELSQTHKDFFAKRDALTEQRSGLEQELFRLNAQEEKLQETMEQLIGYIFEEYQLTPEQAAAHTYENMPSRSQLKQDIRACKAEIRSLGDVNVNAVTEYKELKERHDFLSGQHQDLVEAANTLQKIIRELDDGMRRQFREKFSEIRDEFDKVFQELFGGGKGTLELIEGEDILESGIQIISQPPGKKLQNMMQLSGGEKALTAIALLFAIQDLKPSPFCLLDEIEAALDDNNVGRFARYLHKLTQNTQFIIITHRRGTMTAADRLYGITMQEKGISAMVSVDLIESQLDA